MSLEKYIPQAGVGGDLTIAERVYVGSLIETAMGVNRIPLLACTRTLGRMGGLKRAFNGVHVVLVRNLLHQWFSYSNQFARGQDYFIWTIIFTIFNCKDDQAIVILKNYLEQNGRGPDHKVDDGDDVFIVFVVLHLYLYFCNLDLADFIIDINRISNASKDELAEIEHGLESVVGIHVDLSGANEIVSAPSHLLFDRERVSLTIDMLLHSIDQISPTSFGISKVSSILLDDMWTEYSRYIHYAGSLHRRLTALELLKRPQSGRAASPVDEAGDRTDVLANLRDQQLAEQVRQNDALKEATAQIGALRAEMAALLAEQDQQAGDYERLGEATALVGALRAERDALAEERDRLLIDRVRLEAGVTVAMTQEHSLRADRDALRLENDRLSADQHRLGSELGDVKSLVEGLRTERDTLIEERSLLSSDQAKLRSALAEAAVVAEGLRARRDAFDADRTRLLEDVALLEASLDEATEVARRLKGERDTLEDVSNRLLEKEAQLERALSEAADLTDELSAERNTLVKERDGLSAYQTVLNAELAAAAIEKENLLAERDALARDRDQLSEHQAQLHVTLRETTALAEDFRFERDALLVDGGRLSKEQEHMEATHQILADELATALAERDRLAVEAEALHQALANRNRPEDFKNLFRNIWR